MCKYSKDKPQIYCKNLDIKVTVMKTIPKMSYCKGDLGIIQCTQNISFTRWR